MALASRPSKLACSAAGLLTAVHTGWSLPVGTNPFARLAACCLMPISSFRYASAYGRVAGCK